MAPSSKSRKPVSKTAAAVKTAPTSKSRKPAPKATSAKPAPPSKPRKPASKATAVKPAAKKKRKEWSITIGAPLDPKYQSAIAVLNTSHGLFMAQHALSKAIQILENDGDVSEAESQALNGLKVVQGYVEQSSSDLYKHAKLVCPNCYMKRALTSIASGERIELQGFIRRSALPLGTSLSSSLADISERLSHHTNGTHTMSAEQLAAKRRKEEEEAWEAYQKETAAIREKNREIIRASFEEDRDDDNDSFLDRFREDSR